jgi:FliI/YscN family ATPase
MEGVEPGALVVARGRGLSVGVGEALLGRVVDAFGDPLDGRPAAAVREWRAVTAAAPRALERQPVTTALELGVRALDGLLTCGKGQRLGVFAAAGVGKSTLLGMIARGTAFARACATGLKSRATPDVNVIALVGERGREVRHFIEEHLGEALRSSVVVVSTSDEPALARLKAALTATTIAEYFRDCGRDVLLIMDSLTRVARAQREVGLAAGEAPATRGYPPSVWAMLPQLLERAGTSDRGAITGLYAVLVEGDDMTEPVADAVQAVLDGHIVLSRRLAAEGLYPAVDVAQSISRVMPDTTSADHQETAARFRELWTVWQQARDLIELGAYKPGADPRLDCALRLKPEMDAFLRQRPDEHTAFAETLTRLAEVVSDGP